MRNIFRIVWNLPNNVLKSKLHPQLWQKYSNLARKQEHVTVLNEETLTGRFLQYFNNDKKPKQLPRLKSLKSEKESSINLQQLSIEELFYLLDKTESENKSINNCQVLNKFDLEFCLRISDLDTECILDLLNGYMKLAPNHITEFKSYHFAIKALHKNLKTLNKADFLQFIFYVGLQKKSQLTQEILRQCIGRINNEFIDSLRIEELCVICNSTFKTSTKITNRKLLNKIKCCLNDNLHILKDSALFVTLLKTVRHNRDQDDDLLSTISCAIFFNQAHDLYSFSTICHILALYADYFYYDENVLKTFSRKCLDELAKSRFTTKNEHMSKQLRGKDVKRLLWVLAMYSDLNLVSTNELNEIVLPKIIERIKCGEFDRDASSLIDITLYFWMLKCKPHEIVPYVFNSKSLQQVGRNPKSLLRLNLLLHTISLEDPDLYKQIAIEPNDQDSYSIGYQIKQRPLLQSICRNLNQIKSKLKIDQFKLVQQIPYLNVVGISGFRNGNELSVNIELLDSYTQIRNIEDATPVGLMALKLRLLENSPNGLLVISEDEIEDMSVAELNEFLLDELSLIC